MAAEVAAAAAAGASDSARAQAMPSSIVPQSPLRAPKPPCTRGKHRSRKIEIMPTWPILNRRSRLTQEKGGKKK